MSDKTSPTQTDIDAANAPFAQPLADLTRQMERDSSSAAASARKVGDVKAIRNDAA